MSSLGHWDPKLEARARELLSYRFDEFRGETQTFDFARCQRPDGSFYGTRGQCRKGVEVGPREMKAIKQAAAKGNPKAKAALDVIEGKKTKAQVKKELAGSVQKKPKDGAYSPKSSKGEIGVKATVIKDPFGDKPSAFDPATVQSKIDRVNSSKKPASEKKKLVKELELRKAQAEKNQALVKDLEKNLPKGAKLQVATEGIVISSKTPSGDTVTSTFSPQMGFAFKVNDSYNAGSVTDRAAQIQVASSVRSQYDALVKSLPVGHVVKTSAWTEDGKGAMRQRAYEKMGFSKAIPGDNITAVKQKDGTMAPGAPGNKGMGKHMDQAQDKNSVWFAEPDEQTKLWMQIVFGTKS